MFVNETKLRQVLAHRVDVQTDFSNAMKEVDRAVDYMSLPQPAPQATYYGYIVQGKFVDNLWVRPITDKAEADRSRASATASVPHDIPYPCSYVNRSVGVTIAEHVTAWFATENEALGGLTPAVAIAEFDVARETLGPLLQLGLGPKRFEFSKKPQHERVAIVNRLLTEQLLCA